MMCEYVGIVCCWYPFSWFKMVVKYVWYGKYEIYDHVYSWYSTNNNTIGTLSIISNLD